MIGTQKQTENPRPRDAIIQRMVREEIGRYQAYCILRRKTGEIQARTYRVWSKAQLRLFRTMKRLYDE